ncbi:MAG: hypothetical protein HQL53_08815 [Magnetococcales bacterium]|nr:hypothetical protein [Magnetococcales bacterium]
MSRLDEAIELLISRGLDADLERDEIRRLFILAGRDADVAREMGRMASVEETLLALVEPAEHALPQPDLAQQVARRIAEEKHKKLASPLDTSKPGASSQGFLGRIWGWLRSPHGFTMQPLSFAAGIAASILFVAPAIVKQVDTPLQTARLKVHDLSLIKAKTGTTWSNRFIVSAGETTRMTLRANGGQPVLLQFESVEPIELVVAHQTPGLLRDSVNHVLPVDGVSYATLKDPRQGDEVLIRNPGPVPVLVYMRGIGSDGANIRALSGDRSQSHNL